MNNNDFLNILDFLHRNHSIYNTLVKIGEGQYVTDKERKKAMNDTIDEYAKDLKLKSRSEEEIKAINIQADALKSLIASLKEVNY